MKKTLKGILPVPFSQYKINPRMGIYSKEIDSALL
jgi:hypothetical protein